jgi:hypothetical protein
MARLPSQSANTSTVHTFDPDTQPGLLQGLWNAVASSGSFIITLRESHGFT